MEAAEDLLTGETQKLWRKPWRQRFEGVAGKRFTGMAGVSRAWQAFHGHDRRFTGMTGWRGGGQLARFHQAYGFEATYLERQLA